VARGPAQAGRYFELGHQFEWALLLSHAVEEGLPPRYLGVAERLLNYGMKVAYDQQEPSTELSDEHFVTERSLLGISTRRRSDSFQNAAPERRRGR
jgi:hypothetical protein